MGTPVCTYRLQINAEFDLDAARAQLDYLGRLGIDWIYLSPLLRSAPGSAHGYDVVDTSVVDESRGGRPALEALAGAAHAAGMGVLVDIVPNHMGVDPPEANSWWWDVLANGRNSRFADHFDIDWAAGAGKLRIPVLGDEPDPEIVVEDGVLRYHQHRFPLAQADDTPMPVDEVHARQHYELVNWRRADTDLNYRRFFAVNSLAGVRVEERAVFDDSHAEISRWVREGLVDGLRVDHPDGLADPRRYLDELADFTGVDYVVVEKILVGREQLPQEWATHGTTGYDALADLDRVLIDPAGEAELTAIDAELRGGDQAPAWDELVHAGKRGVADGILQSEVQRLRRQLTATVDGDDDLLADGLAELLAAFPVYRSYLPGGAHQLDLAAELARRRRPDLATTIEQLHAVLSQPSHPAAIRFQQTSGMVMAKGVEDCAFYRFNRLGTLTEVGGDPSEWSIDVAEFHRRQQRRHMTHPHTLTALTTHDTKRSEDTRARITVLAEIASEWRSALERLRERAPLGDGPLAELLWQSIIGSWPAEPERLRGYAEKASREAGTSTSWSQPDPAFESAMHRMIDAAVGDAEVRAEVERLVERVRMPGWINSLSAKLLQITGPGVPDVYQGTELWDHSLVDPDNRRPVDFERRRAMLAALDEALPGIDESGAAKLLVTSRALRLRRDRPELFTTYMPVWAEGPAAHHAIAVDRGGAIAVATRLPVGLERHGGWGDTVIDLGAGQFEEVLTGRQLDGGVLPLAGLLDRYPVALLVRSDGERLA
jgi:(1->4)-alpha-D-glucan 1-alpha-D-glucosylmutase